MLLFSVFFLFLRLILFLLIISSLSSSKSPPLHSSSKVVKSGSNAINTPVQTNQRDHVPCAPPPRQRLADVTGIAIGGPPGQRLGEQGHAVAHYAAFLDFVAAMLRPVPEHRATPAAALKHRFLQTELWAVGGAEGSSTASSPSGGNRGTYGDKRGIKSPRTGRPPSRGMYSAAAKEALLLPQLSLPPSLSARPRPTAAASRSRNPEALHE